MPSPTTIPPRPNYGIPPPGTPTAAAAQAATAAPNTGKGLKKDTATEQAMRQAIRGLVNSIDPTMRLESDVEDVRSRQTWLFGYLQVYLYRCS